MGFRGVRYAAGFGAGWVSKAARLVMPRRRWSRWRRQIATPAQPGSTNNSAAARIARRAR